MWWFGFAVGTAFGLIAGGVSMFYVVMWFLVVSFDDGWHSWMRSGRGEYHRYDGDSEDVHPPDSSAG